MEKEKKKKKKARKESQWLHCTGKESWTKGISAGFAIFLDLLFSFVILANLLGKAMLKSVNSGTRKEVEEENYTLIL